MYYIIYETTNNINGKIYIGAHKTENLNDGYIGSGKHLKRAINKYGIENFIRKILFIFETETEMFLKEKEIVNEEFVKRKDTYNISLGGSGGWNFINSNELNGNNFITKEVIEKRKETRKINFNKRFEEEEDYRQNCIDHLNQIRKLVPPEIREKSRQMAILAWTGNKHSDETLKNLSNNRIGEKNPQYGNKWIYKGNEYKTIKVDKLNDYILDGWQLGRHKPKIKAGIEVKIKTKAGTEVKTIVNSKHESLYSLAPEGTNWCTGHKEFLPINQFHRDKNRHSGYQNKCIKCRKARRKKY